MVILIEYIKFKEEKIFKVEKVNFNLSKAFT